MTLFDDPAGYDGRVDCVFYPGRRCTHPSCDANRRASALTGHPVARHTDPATSWEAAASVRDVRHTQAAVLDLLRRYGPSTDEQIATHANHHGITQSPSGLRTRRRELVDLGLVADTGNRAVTAAGRGTIIWRAVP